VAGLVKNAIDYVQDMADDSRPYLSDRPVGCIATGAG
jgi:FMN reductase